MRGSVSVNITNGADRDRGVVGIPEQEGVILMTSYQMEVPNSEVRVSWQRVCIEFKLQRMAVWQCKGPGVYTVNIHTRLYRIAYRKDHKRHS